IAIVQPAACRCRTVAAPTRRAPPVTRTTGCLFIATPCSMRSELAVKRRPRHVAGAFFLPAAFFAGARRAATFFVAFFAVDLTTLAAVFLRATDFLAVARLRGAAGLVVLRRRAFGAASASG